MSLKCNTLFNHKEITATIMETVLSHFESISLDEMSGIRLMNRTDTKFVTSISKLQELLQMAGTDYYIQEIDGKRNMEYFTVYFDSNDYTFFREHHDGHCNRQKVRIRQYVDSQLNFLEVKTKDNHGKTRKKRINTAICPMSCHQDKYSLNTEPQALDFLSRCLTINPTGLDRKIENRFHRITLVNKAKTERLTIDTDLSFYNLSTNQSYTLPEIAIIELKRDGLIPSPILSMLRQLRIKPLGFSKYCIGEALTNPNLRKNRFKTRIRKILKIKSTSI